MKLQPNFRARNWSVSHYLMLFFLIIGISINALITMLFYNAASLQVMKDITQRLNDIVSISSGLIDTELHTTLTDASRQNSGAYRILKNTLQKIRDASSDIHFIYTMRQTPENQIMFVVDAESNPEKMAKLGDIYDDASILLKKEFPLLKKPVVETEFYKDKWGTWLSGYAPFFYPDGSRAGVLGVDISAETVERYRYRILILALGVFIFSIPLVLFFGWFLGRRIGIPIIAMKTGAEKIAEGDLDVQLEIPGSLELAVLAKTLNRMTEKLKEEQRNLKKMALKYRHIFDNALDGIFQSSPAGELITANASLLSMLGYESLDEMQQDTSGKVYDFYENAGDRDQWINQLMGKGHVNSLPVYMKRKNGSYFWAEISASIQDYQDGSKIVEGTLKDITTRLEKEKAERKRDAAEAASLAKSEFLANMSHEIRTPLNAVMGLTDLVMRTELTEHQKDYLKKIKASSQSLLAVINDILDFSKIEAGHLELEQINFSLFDVMANISEMFGFKAHEKDIELLVSIDEKTPSALTGDPVRLGQILINLVGNALKFTEKGEIIVKVAPLIEKTRDMTSEDICLEFMVKDTGTGIPHDRLESLFDSFSQADTSITRKYGGTGLGLSISRKLTRLMGGDIRIKSEFGVGSVFTFTISLKKQPEKNQILLNPPRDLRGLRVLIVDDNQTSLHILSSAITSFQMEAVTAASGHKAIEILQTTEIPFDFVLMDWKMPEMNGIETAKKIKRNLDIEKIPIVCMVSAYGRKDLIQQADKDVLDAFLHKPVNQSLLFDTIMELFGRHDAVVTKNTLTNVSPDGKPDKILRNKNVLLVEDNEINQEVAMEWLHSAGINISVAENGREALKKLETYMPDAVLMDIQMPEMDGFTATRLIRQNSRFNALPVIAMTAHALKGDREKCMDAGMNDHITKPIDPEKLFSTLSFWLKKGAPENNGDDKKEVAPDLLHDEGLPDGAPFPSDAMYVTKKQFHKLTGDLNIDSSISMEKEPSTPKKESDENQLKQAPTLSGINMELGLFRANQNKTLYLKLLKTFSRDFKDAAAEIKTYMDAGDVDAAGRITHSVKGVSANIGAEMLSQAAGKIEMQINTDGQIKNPDWQTFNLNLDTVLDELNEIINQASQIPSGKEQNHSDQDKLPETKMDSKHLLEEIQKTDSLLDDDLNAARGQIEVIEPLLRNVFEKKQCDALLEHIDNFEIDEASELLTKMENFLKEEG